MLRPLNFEDQERSVPTRLTLEPLKKTYTASRGFVSDGALEDIGAGRGWVIECFCHAMIQRNLATVKREDFLSLRAGLFRRRDLAEEL